ncbi:GNAT family N-acetyltransferase [Arthrobacter bambusae]|uniref:GNAT family N-acetyltransferase n=1 Tax=Arthrobacter bambusae TaxID=1338426 RepID=UPI002783A4E5|nr:GNAT family N-acetyltransferase [Arthrobacter bambusae]MDQ0030417.1 phosphinothricin acetyltransferase [Arthrobacter bambusae]MDQ0098334.1 phosphinothricin acetyltransferase [Arthrobacter bambusae]
MLTEAGAVLIRPMSPGDWPEVRAIFTEGIETGQATFEAAAPDWEQFDASRLPDHRFVAEGSGEVLGWTAVSAVSARPAYAGVVEHSVYVAGPARGRGIGSRLLKALAASTEAHGIWTIQSSIFPENEASIRLHQANGFTVVGRRERIARMSAGPLAGHWRDTLLLERRSRKI